MEGCGEDGKAVAELAQSQVNEEGDGVYVCRAPPPINGLRIEPSDGAIEEEEVVAVLRALPKHISVANQSLMKLLATTLHSEHQVEVMEAIVPQQARARRKQLQHLGFVISGELYLDGTRVSCANTAVTPNQEIFSVMSILCDGEESF